MTEPSSTDVLRKEVLDGLRAVSDGMAVVKDKIGDLVEKDSQIVRNDGDPFNDEAFLDRALGRIDREFLALLIFVTSLYGREVVAELFGADDAEPVQ